MNTEEKIEELKKFLQDKINNSYVGDSYQHGRVSACEMLLKEIKRLFG